MLSDPFDAGQVPQGDLGSYVVWKADHEKQAPAGTQPADDE
jgi:hypothetical protein